MTALEAAEPSELGLSATRLARITEVLEREIQAGPIAGAVVGILRRDRLAMLQPLGLRDPVAGLPMAPDDVFWIASMTKPVVAVAALTMVERGELRLSDPVSSHVPELANPLVSLNRSVHDRTVPRREPTVLDLMRHTSGMVEGLLGNSPAHRLYADAVGDGMTAFTGAEFLDRLAGVPLLHQPGEAWHYSWGFDVLGLIMERISGKPLGDLLAERVLDPLQMNDTSFGRHGVPRHRWALPPEGPGNELPDLSVAAFDSGGAGLVGTAPDYLRFARMLLNRGTSDQVEVLSRRFVSFMMSDQLDPGADVSLLSTMTLCAEGYGFGLGVAVRRQHGSPGIGSVGDVTWPGAAGTVWWADPLEDLAVVLMTHTPERTTRVRMANVIRSLVYQAIAD